MTSMPATARGAAFIAALTGTDQLATVADATTRKEDSYEHWRVMQRLGFIAEGAHLRARAAYQDELRILYEQRLDISEDTKVREQLCVALVFAIDQYVAWPARTKTQATKRRNNVRRWKLNAFAGLTGVSSMMREHSVQWDDVLTAERERFANPRRQPGEVQ